MPQNSLNLEKVVLIGSGNVATHLGEALINNNVPVIEVYSRSLENAKLLADRLNTNFTNDLSKLSQVGTLYVICVKDDVIPSLVSSLLFKPPTLVHTSGCTSIDVLKKYAQYCGVLYPLQTFSKSKLVSFSNIPLCVEGNDKDSLNHLTKLANSLSNNVYQINSNQRAALHLSAVFSCNFVNYLYTIGAKLLKENQLPFNLLYPLIKETADKALSTQNPFTLQTGPAIREDNKIIDQHLTQLGDKDLKELYATLTAQIIKEKTTHEL